jgi:N-acetylneuraminic acid mutarotase
MSQRFDIIRTLIVLASVAAASGCSSVSNPLLASHRASVELQKLPQSGGTWSTKANMPTARVDFAVGVVHGIVYAVGGGDSGIVEAYDPASDNWTTKAPMPTGRDGLAIGIINGILYAVGGEDFNGYLNTLEAYDPATNAWTTKSPMPASRVDLAAAVVNGVIYVVGGLNHGQLNTVEAYTP